MKRVIIPYIETLSHVNIEEACDLLDDFGKREAVDELNWAKEFPYRPITSFAIGYSDDGIYIKFNVQGSMLRAIYSKDQDPVCEDSCVEFFCKLPESEYYTNFEFNCIGACRASKRKSRKRDVQPFSLEQLALIKRSPSLDKRAFKELEGLFTWDLTFKIPFELIGIDQNNIPEKILGNFYKCADGTGSPHYLSWTPIKTEKPNFHCPEFFGELYFEKKK